MPSIDARIATALRDLADLFSERDAASARAEPDRAVGITEASAASKPLDGGHRENHLREALQDRDCSEPTPTKGNRP
jgi:hypothetical protein